jgi:hypothetical protein
MVKNDDIFAGMAAAANAGRRSSQYQWMLTNHDRFAAILAQTGKPNWSEIARYQGEIGLRDKAGNIPTATATRLTWLKVRKAHEKAQAKMSGLHRAAHPVGPPPSGLRSRATPVVAVHDDDDDRPLPTLKNPT